MAVEGTVEGFDFNGLVRALVIAHIGRDPEVQDVLEIAAEDTVRDLVDTHVDELELVDQSQFSDLDDRVYQLEEDMDTSDEAVEDLEHRVDALEKEYVPDEDFIALEQDFMKLEALVRKYQPLLEALSKIEPLLRMLGIVHDEEKKVHHQQPPRHPYFHMDEPRPVRSNWHN